MRLLKAQHIQLYDIAMHAKQCVLTACPVSLASLAVAIQSSTGLWLGPSQMLHVGPMLRTVLNWIPGLSQYELQRWTSFPQGATLPKLKESGSQTRCVVEVSGKEAWVAASVAPSLNLTGCTVVDCGLYWHHAGRHSVYVYIQCVYILQQLLQPADGLCRAQSLSTDHQSLSVIIYKSVKLSIASLGAI